MLLCEWMDAPTAPCPEGSFDTFSLGVAPPQLRIMLSPSEGLRDELERLLGSQAHVLRYWEELSEGEHLVLAQQIRQLDVPYLNEAFSKSFHPPPLRAEDILQPPSDRYFVRDELSEEERNRYFDRGPLFF